MSLLNSLKLTPYEPTNRNNSFLKRRRKLIDQTPFFIPDLEFSFDNSLLSQESGLLPVLAGDTQDWYAVFWYYNEPATSQS